MAPFWLRCSRELNGSFLSGKISFGSPFSRFTTAAPGPHHPKASSVAANSALSTSFAETTGASVETVVLGKNEILHHVKTRYKQWIPADWYYNAQYGFPPESLLREYVTAVTLRGETKGSKN